MKNKNSKKLVTQSEFRKFTEGTFEQFLRDRFDPLANEYTQFVQNRFEPLSKEYKQFIETRFEPFYKEFNQFKELEFKNVVNRLTFAIIKNQQDIDEMKQNMATKSDINRILDRFDFYAGKNKITDQEQGVQAFHIKELRETSQQHEIRIGNLEAARGS